MRGQECFFVEIPTIEGTSLFEYNGGLPGADFEEILLLQAP